MGVRDPQRPLWTAAIVRCTPPQVMMKRGWRFDNVEIETHRLLHEQLINAGPSHDMPVFADTHLKTRMIQNTSKLEPDGVHSLCIHARLIHEGRATLHRMFVTLRTGKCFEDKRIRSASQGIMHT